MNWAAARVILTGGAGFLGRVVHQKLTARGCTQVIVPRSRECDLRDPDAIRRLLKDAKPTLILHLAAVVGGIGANRVNPGKFFYDNAVMGIHLIEEARLAGVAKFVQVGTICAYPKFTPVPFKEEALWDGYPEETNAPYGLAKKMLLVQLQAYRQQYGFNGIYLLPVNLYGPGDNFDLETSHVIPAMIRKMVEAKRSGAPAMPLWGTGTPTREFLYVDDAAEGILKGAEGYDGPEPVNLGSGQEISIRDLAGLIRSATGFTGELTWNSAQPDGQPRRGLDTARAARLFGFRAAVPLAEGLQRTVDWFTAQTVAA